MSELDQIFDRWGFRVPNDYLAAEKAGLVVHDDDRCILLSDTQWLSLNAMANFSLPKHRADWLLPFARSARGDLWSWDTRADIGNLSTVLFCPRDDDCAQVYAHGFTQCLCRLLLEEFSSTWMVGDQAMTVDDAVEYFRSIVERTSFLFPESWNTRLHEIVGKNLSRYNSGEWGFISYSDVQSVLEKDLRISNLNERVSINV